VKLVDTGIDHEWVPSKFLGVGVNEIRDVSLVVANRVFSVHQGHDYSSKVFNVDVWQFQNLTKSFAVLGICSFVTTIPLE